MVSGYKFKIDGHKVIDRRRIQIICMYIKSLGKRKNILSVSAAKAPEIVMTSSLFKMASTRSGKPFPSSRDSLDWPWAEIVVVVGPHTAVVISRLNFAYRIFVGLMVTAVMNRLITSSRRWLAENLQRERRHISLFSVIFFLSVFW